MNHVSCLFDIYSQNETCVFLNASKFVSHEAATVNFINWSQLNAVKHLNEINQIHHLLFIPVNTPDLASCLSVFVVFVLNTCCKSEVIQSTELLSEEQSWTES